MKEKILIVEDQFVEADYLRMMLSKAGYTVCDIARSVVQARTILEEERPDIVLVDIFLKGKLTGIDLAKELQRDNIPFVYLSANSDEDILSAAKATQPYGFLVKPFREKDLLVTLEIARYRHEHSLESRLQKEEVLKMQLASLLIGNGTWEQKLFHIAKIIQPYIPFDFIGAGFNTLGEGSCYATSFLRISFDEYQTIDVRDLLQITGLTMPKLLQLHALNQIDVKPALYNEQDFLSVIGKPSLKKLFAKTFSMQSHLSLPLHLSNGESFSFCFYSRRPDAYHPDHISLFERVELTWTKSVETMVSHRLDNTKPARNEDTGNFQPNENQGFEGIIGKSHLMLAIFDQITVVAPSETSVLILGESGTGKERIADSIHRLSPRNRQTFIKVNCAALPPTLIESELFGHEKGSFTGAFDKRIGKFEQADKGTIFLDEIGELPLEFQVKLLRVLQEKEIERIGSKSVTKVDVRIIAATNRNLEKEVAAGRFRLDLYYRLNVFPIELPALRQRKEDIPELAYYFLNFYNRKAGRKITTISDKVLRDMMSYNWPGNVRELQHKIERSVLLAGDHIIEELPLPSDRSEETTSFAGETRIKTIRENERDHILLALKKSNGRVWGSGGAAEILNILPSTLKSKMKKLGIRKEFID